MIKRIVCLLLSLLLLFALSFSAFAAEDTDFLTLDDGAGLLNESEQSALEKELADLSRRYGMAVIVVTTDDLNGKSPMAYADDYYDEYCGDADGVLLLVSMEDNDWWISTCGFGITAFTDAGIEYMSEQFVPYLSDGDFATAFDTFTELCDDFIRQAKTGDPYDSHNLPKEPFRIGMSIAISVVLGFLLALIVTGSMRSQLRSVRMQPAATSYVKKDSMQVTVYKDLYLYSTLTRRRRENQNGSSTHRSASGRTHGGGGGKF